MAKPRARALGLPLEGDPGPWNAITDVPGIAVGYTTLIRGEGPLVVGQGPVRTGVTAIVPHADRPEPTPTWAGFHALNGNGEMTGTHWIADAGYCWGPVCITNTHSVGMVHHGAVGWMVARHAELFAQGHLWAMPVVAETYDGILNDINGRHITEAHVRQALDSARSGPVAEGNVGGGTGMVCYDFKGGTGASSRRIAIAGQGYTVGVLVQANHGMREWLTVCGVPVGRQWPPDDVIPDGVIKDREQGSIVVVIATDVPLLPHQLQRVARRATIGVGRGGTPGGNCSGDLFLALSVANPLSLDALSRGRYGLTATGDDDCDVVYLATVQATEEAVLNALLAAEDMTSLKPAGQIVKAVDPKRLSTLVQRSRPMP
ncbi:MAG: P1 family peptidase [Candidatus Competibacterales bacterium]